MQSQRVLENWGARDRKGGQKGATKHEQTEGVESYTPTHKKWGCKRREGRELDPLTYDATADAITERSPLPIEAAIQGRVALSFRSKHCARVSSVKIREVHRTY